MLTLPLFRRRPPSVAHDKLSTRFPSASLQRGRGLSNIERFQAHRKFLLLEFFKMQLE
jgi:hypothetical protein